MARIESAVEIARPISGARVLRPRKLFRLGKLGLKDRERRELVVDRLERSGEVLEQNIQNSGSLVARLRDHELLSIDTVDHDTSILANLILAHIAKIPPANPRRRGATSKQTFLIEDERLGPLRKDRENQGKAKSEAGPPEPAGGSESQEAPAGKRHCTDSSGEAEPIEEQTTEFDRETPAICGLFRLAAEAGG
jgi:hypothetical protein